MKIALTYNQKNYLKSKFGILAMDEAKVLNHTFNMKYLEIGCLDEFDTSFVTKVPSNKEQRQELEKFLESNTLFSRSVCSYT